MNGSLHIIGACKRMCRMQMQSKSIPSRCGLDAIEPRWFAIRTLYRHEKSTQNALERGGITTYVPLQKVARQYQRKVRTAEIPLIHTYVFVQITAAQYISVLQTPDVFGFVKTTPELNAIPMEEIELLRRITEGGYVLNCEEELWNTGEYVEIMQGPLTGMIGCLKKFAGKHKVMIQLQAIAHVLSMEIPILHLRKLNTHELKRYGIYPDISRVAS